MAGKKPDKKRPNITAFLAESASEELHLLLRGHLHLEALLDDLLKRSVAHPAALDETRQTFHTRVKLLRAVGGIDEATEKTLLAVNRLRNKVAHEIGFAVSFSDAFDLVTLAAAAGVDFSDDTIHEDRHLSEEWYGTHGILWEVVGNTFHELLYRNEDLFTEEEFGEYLA